MHLPLAISSALLLGSYVTAIPVWPNDDSEASGSGLGNNFYAPASHDATHFPPSNNPLPDHSFLFHPNFGSLPDPAHQFQSYQPPPAQQLDAIHYPLPNHPSPGHQFQPYQPPPAQQLDAIHYPLPNHPLPGHSSLDHHNLDPAQPPQEPLHLDNALGDSRGGLFGIPYRCTGCRHQSPAPEPGPGPGVDSAVPSTHANRNNRPAGGADRQPRIHNNPNPYTRTGRRHGRGDPGPSSSGSSGTLPVSGGHGILPNADGRYNCPYPGCDRDFKYIRRLKNHHKDDHGAPLIA